MPEISNVGDPDPGPSGPLDQGIRIIGFFRPGSWISDPKPIFGELSDKSTIIFVNWSNFSVTIQKFKFFILSYLWLQKGMTKNVYPLLFCCCCWIRDPMYGIRDVKKFRGHL
jgi:hypothetical protein